MDYSHSGTLMVKKVIENSFVDGKLDGLFTVWNDNGDVIKISKIF